MPYRIERKDLVPGGEGDKAEVSDFDPKEVRMGVKVEMEHTDDRRVALEICLDHLSEDPHYYSKLKKIHKEAVMDIREAVGWLESVYEDLAEATLAADPEAVAKAKAAAEKIGRVRLPGMPAFRKKGEPPPVPTRRGKRPARALKPESLAYLARRVIREALALRQGPPPGAPATPRTRGMKSVYTPAATPRRGQKAPPRDMPSASNIRGKLADIANDPATPARIAATKEKRAGEKRAALKTRLANIPSSKEVKLKKLKKRLKLASVENLAFLARRVLREGWRLHQGKFPTGSYGVPEKMKGKKRTDWMEREGQRREKMRKQAGR